MRTKMGPFNCLKIASPEKRYQTADSEHFKDQEDAMEQKLKCHHHVGNIIYITDKQSQSDQYNYNQLR